LAAAQQKAFAAQQAAAKAKAEALRAGKAVEAAAQDAKPAQVLTGKKGLGKLFGPLGYGTRTSLEAAGGAPVRCRKSSRRGVRTKPVRGPSYRATRRARTRKREPWGPT